SGKTTTAINLGATLGALEHPVLLVDCDPQGNATRSLGQHAEPPHLYHALGGEAPVEDVIRREVFPGLDLLPTDRELVGVEIELVGIEGWQRRLADLLAPVRERYHTILLDCPP